MTESQAAPRVAVDAMGGDHGPGVVVEGTLLACRELGLRATLVGPRDVVQAAMLAAVYTAAGRLGLLIEPVGGFATLVWAPTGIALSS